MPRRASKNREPGARPARLTPWNLLSFGLGGLPYHLGVNALKHLSYPVFNVLLGVNPWLIGSLHMLIRL